MARRLGRALLYSAGLGLGGGLGYSLHQSEGDISNIGPVRSAYNVDITMECKEVVSGHSGVCKLSSGINISGFNG